MSNQSAVQRRGDPAAACPWLNTPRTEAGAALECLDFNLAISNASQCHAFVLQTRSMRALQIKCSGSGCASPCLDLSDIGQPCQIGVKPRRQLIAGQDAHVLRQSRDVKRATTVARVDDHVGLFV